MIMILTILQPQKLTIWLFNIAMENHQNKWRFLAAKIIYFYGLFSMAMLNNQRVNDIPPTSALYHHFYLLKFHI